MGYTRTTVIAVLCGVILATAAACQPLDETPGTGRPTGTAAEQLDALTVASWGSMSRYSRDRFEHWSRQDGGCNTRDLVLRRDGRGVATGPDCDITAGTWTSPYDGKTVADPTKLDIDHVVPLANAWRTGASDWSDAQRERFANDMDTPELLAVTSTTNRAKGDQDPSQWRPPLRDYWCTYARKWISVKSHWKLSITAAEKSALVDMLETC
jgi:Protein of unknown function (DUF1524)